MHEIDSILFEGYKCFENGYTGFENIKNVNLIIGRNNSGKSSALDVIGHLISDQYKIEIKDIILGKVISEEEITKTYHNDTRFNDNSYLYDYIGKILFIKIDQKLKGLQYTPQFNHVFKSEYKPYWDNIIQRIHNPFQDYLFFRLSSERDIIPEVSNDIKNITITSNGNGITNILQNVLHNKKYDRHLVDKILLSELNTIIYPDTEFVNILSQYINNNSDWEILLEEKGKGDIPLSKLGSGIKTILLVLVYLQLLPMIKGRLPLDKIVFAFEELENNLHPALQRRLFEYIYDWAVKNDSYFFITSHSHVAINVLNDKEKAQIYTVVKENNNTVIRKITSYFDKIELLNDLDVRASDILQSNGVIWVEGPSDKIYLNRWIEIFSNGELREGRHYQILFYGGRLLCHYGVCDTEKSITEIINILLTNRNCAILIDSDKKNKQYPVNETKKRIQSDFETIGAMCWITNGKEIENYIPKEAIENMYNTQLAKGIGQYDYFENYLDNIKNNEGKKFLNNKVAFATNIKNHLNRENLSKILDLRQRTEELCKLIRLWNRMN